jgi:microcystin-dependent protein
MDMYMGTIIQCAFNFAPRGWALCNGQTLNINTNTALFSLLGTTYGGDGVTTFKLPDLRGRVSMGTGEGAGLTNRILGETGGEESTVSTGTGVTAVTIGVNNLPSQTPTATLSLTDVKVNTNISVGTGATGGALIAAEGSTLTGTTGGGSATAAAIYLPAATAQTSPVNLGGVTSTLSGVGTVTITGIGGNNAPIPISVPVQVTTETIPPFLGINYIICLEGIFPSRN